MTEKRAKTLAPVHDLIANRWSPRAIDGKRPVEREKLVAILEAARLAPSAFGDEPWRFLVFDRHHDEASWKKAFGLLAEGNQFWNKETPVLVLVLADTLSRLNGKPNPWGAYDTGAATQNLHLEAVAQGLVTHPMGGFDGPGFARAFGIPERFSPVAVVAVGYPGSIDQLQGKLRELEEAPRARRPFEESVFAGEFGKPLAPK